VKIPAVQKETRFSEAQKERSKVHEDKRAARRARLEQQAPEMLAAAEEQQRELREKAELDDAEYALQDLQENPPKIKNPVLLADYKVQVAQAELDLAAIKCKKLKHHEQEQILFPLRKRLEAATIHANCCHI
jgi:leucyl aminopeptidase